MNKQFLLFFYITIALASKAQTPLTISYITGKFDPAKHKDFTPIDKKYTTNNNVLYLRKETYAAFQKMATAAEKDSILLTIISATRNFEYQKQIWENKWKNLATTKAANHTKATKIMEYSAMPGASRHHWGSDIDLNNLDNRFFDNGEGKKIYTWLKTHAAAYNFCQPYTPNRPTGYKEERWHWSYMPIAKACTQFAKTHLKDAQITGFSGAPSAQKLEIVKNYVLSINPDCRE